MTPPTDWDAEARLWARARNVLVASFPRTWTRVASDPIVRAKREGYALAVMILAERERAAREMAAHLKELAAA